MGSSGLTPVLKGQVKDGRILLEVSDKGKLAAMIRTLEGKRIEMVLRGEKSRRSTPQNSLYWAVYIPAFCESTGYTPEEMHEAFKIKFLSRDDAKFPTVRSTGALSTAEFSDFIDKIERLAAEYQIFIPKYGQAE